jgi:hypothetical protein
MLDRVHDLRELGSRPYNLRLIQDQVERIEAIHRQGGHVGVADLYEGLVHQWTRRDSPKHRLDRDHKLLLMEPPGPPPLGPPVQESGLPGAGGLAPGPARGGPPNPAPVSGLSRPEEGLGILQEDLRNASFLVREGEEGVRFAHTSIMEFFLARALFRALEQAGNSDQDQDVERTLAVWAIPVPSPETLDFLGELLRQSDATA